jgi:hypothetical protein
MFGTPAVRSLPSFTWRAVGSRHEKRIITTQGQMPTAWFYSNGLWKLALMVWHIVVWRETHVTWPVLAAVKSRSVLDTDDVNMRAPQVRRDSNASRAAGQLEHVLLARIPVALRRGGARETTPTKQAGGR